MMPLLAYIDPTLLDWI